MTSKLFAPSCDESPAPREEKEEHIAVARERGTECDEVAGKFFGRLRDDDTVLVIHLRSFEERDRLLENEAAAFFTTDHYRNYQTVLVRLARVKKSCWPRCWRMRGVVPRRAVWSRNTTPAEQPDLVSNAVQW